MVPPQQAAGSEKCRELDEAGASLHRSFVFLADPRTRDRLSSQHAPGRRRCQRFHSSRSLSQPGLATPDSRPTRTVTHWFFKRRPKLETLIPRISESGELQIPHHLH